MKCASSCNSGITDREASFRHSHVEEEGGDGGLLVLMGTQWKVLAPEDWWVREMGQIGGGFSLESEHDLSLMVREFLESSGGSRGGATSSWCSSDSESGLPDLALLADKIQFYKYSVTQHEFDSHSLVHSLLLSISEKDLRVINSGPCNASCIRFHLVELLRLSGYDAAVCCTKWQGSDKVPGWDHEYVEVANYSDDGPGERLIIDIDFRSHFEIARAVDSYDRILNSLPVVYVGSCGRLKHLLQVMAEAARSSLKQNSMPLPPWRSLAYLQAKWQSPYQRHHVSRNEQFSAVCSSRHEQCSGRLKRIQRELQSQLEAERLYYTIKKTSTYNGSRKTRDTQKLHV